MCSNSFVACFGCMEEDINALGLSAQDVNVKRCTHFAPTLWSEDIQYYKHNMVRNNMML